MYLFEVFSCIRLSSVLGWCSIEVEILFIRFDVCVVLMVWFMCVLWNMLIMVVLVWL